MQCSVIALDVGLQLQEENPHNLKLAPGCLIVNSWCSPVWLERPEGLAEYLSRFRGSIEIMSVSIIVPTFNGASRIGNCLDALLKQTAGRDAEILVVNDGSADNTADVVARYSGVRLITQSNAGPAAARNRGALAVGGRLSCSPTMIACRCRSGWPP